MGLMIDPTKIFERPWQRYRTDKTYPHPVYVFSSTGNHAVLVLQRSAGHEHRALSDRALRYVADGCDDGRLVKAWVAQVDSRTVLRYIELPQLRINIGNFKPYDGIH